MLGGRSPSCTGDGRLHVLGSRVNITVEIELQRNVGIAEAELDDVISSTPAIVENCFSSGVATDDAIVSGSRREARPKPGWWDIPPQASR